MRAETFEWLQNIFSNKAYAPTGDGAEMLRNQVSAQQATMLNQLASVVLSTTGNRRSREAEALHIFQLTDRYINKIVQTLRISVSNVDGVETLTGDPFLMRPGLPESPPPIDSELRELTIAAFFAALIWETRRTIPVNLLPDPLPPVVSAELASYASWRAINELASGTAASFGTQMDRAKEDVTNAIDAFRGEYRGTSQAIEANLSGLSERVNQATEAARIVTDKAAQFDLRIEEITVENDARAVDFADKYDASEKTAEAFMQAIRTKANFEDLKIHWINRAKSAWWAWLLSSMALFALLIAIPAWGLRNHASLTLFVQELVRAASGPPVTEGDTVAFTVSTISRLVLITVPVALYFWVIRLVVRFNMRSMLLMDDARQRATMLETYYRMIERSAATVEDRALVLQALMRPAPGHGPDSVDPPNFTEVIDKAIGKKA